MSDDISVEIQQQKISVEISPQVISAEMIGMGVLEHNTLSGKQGGVAPDEFYHLSSSDNDDLAVVIGGGDTALHYHSADRARANHTGTQLLATISDAGTMAVQDADAVNISGGVIAGVSGVVADIGDIMTGTLQINVPTITSEALVLKTTDDNATKNILQVLLSDDSIILEVGRHPASAIGRIAVGRELAVISSKGYQALFGSFTSGTVSRVAIGGDSGSGNGGAGFDFYYGNDFKWQWFMRNQGATAQSYALTTNQNSYSGSRILVNPDGNVGINTGATLPLGQFSVVNDVVTDVAVVIRAAAAQTAPVQEWQNSSGVAQLAIAANGRDFVLDTTTGTVWGTATNQKQAWWGATPIVQPTTAIAAATFVANSSGIVDDSATFDGYTIGQIVKILRDIGAAA